MFSHRILAYVNVNMCDGVLPPMDMEIPINVVLSAFVPVRTILPFSTPARGTEVEYNTVFLVRRAHVRFSVIPVMWAS